MQWNFATSFSGSWAGIKHFTATSQQLGFKERLILLRVMYPYTISWHTRPRSLGIKNDTFSLPLGVALKSHCSSNVLFVSPLHILYGVFSLPTARAQVRVNKCVCLCVGRGCVHTHTPKHPNRGEGIHKHAYISECPLFPFSCLLGFCFWYGSPGEFKARQTYNCGRNNTAKNYFQAGSIYLHTF